MSKTIVNPTAKKILLVAALGLAPLLVGLRAKAAAVAPAPCIVTSVQYDEGRLFATCGGTQVYSFAPSFGNVPPKCFTSQLDTVKTFQQMMLAASLAGRKVQMTFEPIGACGVNNLYAIQVN